MAKKNPLSLSLPIETGLDQPTKLKHPDKILTDIESTVLFAKERKRPDISFGLLHKFDDLGRLSSTALAFGLHLHQQTFFPDDEAGFLEDIFSRFGKSPDSVRHYLRAGQAIDDLRQRCGPEILSQWFGRPVADWIALGQFQAEHGELTAKQLAKLVQEPDTHSLRQALQKRDRKAQATPNSAILYRTREGGSLWAWQGAQSEEIGYLAAPKTDMGRKALERLKRRLHIQET